MRDRVSLLISPRHTNQFAMTGWLSFCFLAISTLLALRLFLKLSGGKRSSGLKHLPPGPWTLPIIGSLHHVVRVLPHRTMMRLSHRYGPLMLLRLGQVPTVVVSTAEASALVMKTNDLLFASRPCGTTQDIFSCGGKDIAFAPYGDRWRQMRKICVMELLSSRQVKRMEGIRAEEVRRLVRSIASGAAAAGVVVNVSEKVTAYSNNVVSASIFGGNFTRQEEYLREFDNVMALVAGFCPVDLFPSSRLVRWLSTGERRMKTSYGRIQSIIADIVKAHKAARGAAAPSTTGEDLLDVLLRLQEEDTLAFPLDTETIGAILFDILGAATDSAATILEWAMSELINHPEVMAKAQLEVRTVLGGGLRDITNSDLSKLSYMQMIIKEVLRLHPSAPVIPRIAREDCKIMGYDILEGTHVFINVFAVSRDPKYWNNPDEFIPERFKNSDVDYSGTFFQLTPFGAGRRQCPAIQFGASTLMNGLTNLLYHFDWMLPDNHRTSSVQLDMSEKFGLTVSRRHELQLKAIPHVWLKDMTSK